MKFRFEPALKLLTAFALAAVAAPLCHGQQKNPRPNSTQGELQRALERELLFREMEESMSRRPAPPQPSRQPVVAQINEDFERIQIINHALAQSSAAGEELDFKLVAQAASEIKKRAGRLKENLSLPVIGEERPKSSDAIGQGQLKESLAALDRLVNSFVNNPGFRSVKVVDPQWSARARGDLEEIIELSGRLKKSCEQLHKAAQKSH
jgi:hypothetical protein